MKKGLIILMLLMLQIVPVMGSEQEEKRPYVPGDEEVGGTIYGMLSGKSLEEQPTPDPAPDPNPGDGLDTLPDVKNPNVGMNGGQNTGVAGSNTGDASTLFWWIILFVGAYIVLRMYNVKEEK